MTNAAGADGARDLKSLTRRFVDFARYVLDEREESGTVRGIKSERNRFALHVEHAAFAEKPLEDISRADLEEWLRGMSEKLASDTRGHRKLSADTIRRSLSLCSHVFHVAGPKRLGLIENNPFYGLNADKFLLGEGDAEREGEADDEESWTLVTPEEQAAIASCDEMSESDRLTILFAIGTGLAQAEQFNLRIEDLRAFDETPHVCVRRASNGREALKKRDVHLLGPSLKAARRWLQILPTFAPDNPQNLLFPSSRGTPRGVGKPLGRGRAFTTALQKAGIERPVRWADLRVTCAASMALGHWGHRFSMPEVQSMLGISNVHAMARYSTLFERQVVGNVTSLPAVRQRATTAAEADSDRSVISARVVSASLLRADRAEIAHSVDQISDGDETTHSASVAVIAQPRAWNAKRVDLAEATIAPFAERLALPAETLARAAAALSMGKHLLLVGPPGTGKTELADAFVQAAVADGYCAGAHVATASADWTTFDTIGGYSVQRNGRLRFRPGALLKAIEHFKWLVIDELNRADVDRAFGELMTVLSGKTTDTTYELDGGKGVRIGPDPTASHFMPPTFRLLATMNTWDKTSLFRLSYAIQRRFAVVHVNVPTDPAYAALLRRHAKTEGHEGPLDVAVVDRIVELFSSRGLLAVREIGPAVALDVVHYLRRRTTGDGAASAGDAIAEAMAMFVLPQLDGLVQADAERAYRTVSTSLRGYATRGCINELRGRFEELLPHVRLPSDDP